MQTLIKSMVLVVSLCWSAVIMAEQESLKTDPSKMTEDELKQHAINRLNKASRWFIEKGVYEYYRHGESRDWIQDEVHKEWVVGTLSGPGIYPDESVYKVRNTLKARSILSDIFILYSQEENGALYEYWVIKFMGTREDSGINRECKFFVTRSTDFRSQRTILKEDNMFFDSYQIDERTILKLPLDNLDVLYMLNAWEYPACYGDSDLIDYATFPDKKGNLIKKKLNWYEKNFLQKKFY